MTLKILSHLTKLPHSAKLSIIAAFYVGLIAVAILAPFFSVKLLATALIAADLGSLFYYAYYPTRQQLAATHNIPTPSCPKCGFELCICATTGPVT